jgi:hypothetical protein
MTCNELRNLVETERSVFRAENVLSAEIAAHIQQCSWCRRWIQIEDQLNGKLNLLRHSAPAVPAALDESLLASYRKQMQQPATALVSAGKASPSRGMLWRAAIAAVLLIGAIIFFGNRKRVAPPLAARVQQQSVAAEMPIEPRTSAEMPKSGTAKKLQKRHFRGKAIVPRTEDVAGAGAAMEAADSLPPDFRSLMYCDQLSCSGAMEVIRMNLPASALGMTSPLRSSNIIAADVVVGADGVARAIRIVN